MPPALHLRNIFADNCCHTFQRLSEQLFLQQLRRLDFWSLASCPQLLASGGGFSRRFLRVAVGNFGAYICWCEGGRRHRNLWVQHRMVLVAAFSTGGGWVAVLHLVTPGQAVHTIFVVTDGHPPICHRHAAEDSAVAERVPLQTDGALINLVEIHLLWAHFFSGNEEGK